MRLIGFVALVLSLLGPVAAQTPAGPFVEKPYLQLGNLPHAAAGESLALLWHAGDEKGEWVVEVKTRKDDAWRNGATPASQTVKAPGIEPHRVYRATLVGLPPGEQFVYRVSKNGRTVFQSSGLAPKSASQKQHFVVLGDISEGTESQRAVAYQLSLAKPDFVFIPGDIVYSAGRISEYRGKFFPVYNAEKASPAIGAPLMRSIPFIAAVGNHDTNIQNFPRFPDALAYFLYWEQPLNGPDSKPGDPNTPILQGNKEAQPAFLAASRPRYPRMANFSFDYGNAHWTVLDSNPYMDWTDTGLRKWLENDLASAKNATWRFVAFHHPGFNSAKAHFDYQRMRVLSGIFEAHKVDVVFSGHVHNYQRTFPLTFTPKAQGNGKLIGPKGDVNGHWKLDKGFEDGQSHKPEGVIYMVTGAGGAHLYVDKQAGTLQPFTNKYNAGTHSFTVVDIDGEQLKIRQVSESGQQLDAFQIGK
jgi:predicted phosphodiesterase